jgi:hypothetical protein
MRFSLFRSTARAAHFLDIARPRRAGSPPLGRTITEKQPSL